MDKPDRARAFMREIDTYDRAYGRNIPPRQSWATTPTREIVFGKFKVLIIRDSRVELGYQGGDRIGERIVEDPGSLLVIINVFGNRRFAANYKGDAVDIYHHQPGPWELSFGADPGPDTRPILPNVFQDERDPVWRRLKEQCIKELEQSQGDTADDGLRPCC